MFNKVFRRKMVAVMASLFVFAAVVGTAGIVADMAGWAITPSVHACSPGSSDGGGC